MQLIGLASSTCAMQLFSLLHASGALDLIAASHVPNISVFLYKKNAVAPYKPDGREYFIIYTLFANMIFDLVACAIQGFL